MRGRNLPTMAWVLLGILIIAALSIGLGRSESEAVPTSFSYLPSGTRALSELLKTQGYKVKNAGVARQDFLPQEIPIAFEMTGRYGDKPSPLSVQATEQFSEFISKGGRGILLQIPKDFDQSSKTAASQVAQASDFGGSGGKINVYTDESETQMSGETLLNLASAYGQRSMADIEGHDKGRVLVVNDGIIATNRFISLNDNAQEIMRWVAAIAPKGSTLVFDEATIGSSEPPGILESIGGWAEAAWWQLIFLFIVIAYSLGKPFGLPTEERPVQRGARELVDAAAQTFRRGQATDVAMALIMRDVDMELRAKLKLPSDVPASERDRLLPGDLGVTLKMAEAASHERIEPVRALVLAKRLDRRLAEFLGQPKAVRKRKKAA